jgi:DNA-directed RNA polymerase specialized sigma24 family protein
MSTHATAIYSDFLPRLTHAIARRLHSIPTRYRLSVADTIAADTLSAAWLTALARNEENEPDPDTVCRLAYRRISERIADYLRDQWQQAAPAELDSLTTDEDTRCHGITDPVELIEPVATDERLSAIAFAMAFIDDHMTQDELAGAFGVSDRTIRRDMERLRNAYAQNLIAGKVCQALDIVAHS